MNFSSNFFLKPCFFGFFRELNVRKFRKFSPDHFYDENFQFYDKKTDFRPGMEISSETTIPGISSETTIPVPYFWFLRSSSFVPVPSLGAGRSLQVGGSRWRGREPPGGIVVSLEIPESSSHSRFRNRRLTRDSRIPASIS